MLRALLAAALLLRTVWLSVDGAPSIVGRVPANGTVGVPLGGFSILLEFSESVQAGWGSIEVVASTALQNKVLVPCWKCAQFGSRVVVPVRDMLISNVTHSVQIPPTCFQSATSGAHMAEDSASYMFTTLPESASSSFAYDSTSPTSLDRSLLMPAEGAWTTSSAGFVLFFTEAVQQGVTPIHILWTNGETDSRTIFGPVTQHLDPSIPGKVTVHSQITLAAGAEY